MGPSMAQVTGSGHRIWMRPPCCLVASLSLLETPCYQDLTYLFQNYITLAAQTHSLLA